MASFIDDLKTELGDEWLPRVYESRVRSDRTRAYKLEVSPRENRAEIQYTLLGIELKVGRRRFACPDLATARYLRIFARLGVREFAIPYDISQISGIADLLETTWQQALLLTESANVAKSKLVKAMRDEITKIGPGDAMPLFDRETRQRN